MAKLFFPGRKLMKAKVKKI